MLTIAVRLKDAFCKMMFKYYGILFDVCNEKVKEYTEKEDYENAEYWQEKCVECVTMRQIFLDERLKLRDYLI